MLDVYEFGRVMIQTKDLDPLYVGLKGAQMPRDQLCRWLSAYMMFYDVGLASYLSEFENTDFGRMALIAAANEIPSPVGGRWPRASERRHFRGQKCVKAAQQMFEFNPFPEGWVSNLTGCRTEKDVIKEVSKWPLHGKWAGFKLADLLETVMEVPIKFDEEMGLLYEAPRAALDLLAKEEPSKTAQEHYAELSLWIKQFETPHKSNRRCGPQELETVLCKWKSYRGGHYHVGKDTHEHRKALAGWGKTADKLLESYPHERVTSE